jgi:adenylate cyclase class 2
MSSRETEVKLPVHDLDQARQQLQDLGAAIHLERHFEDNLVFDTADLKLRRDGLLLRLRTAGTHSILTFKGPQRISEGVKDREEIECDVAPPESMIRILQQMGYAVTFRYQKFRTVHEIAGARLHICLDETPIGNYLELEGEIEEIHNAAGRLGYRRTDYITESYAALYFRWCREQGLEPSHMTFP